MKRGGLYAPLFVVYKVVIPGFKQVLANRPG